MWDHSKNHQRSSRIHPDSCDDFDLAGRSRRMNFDFFLKVNQFRVSVGQYASAEDFVDVLNYMVTPMVLIFFAGVTASKQYLFTPIQCWNNKELDSSHRIEYAENLCWVDDMYYWSLGKTLPHDSKDSRHKAKIYYYQWVPFMLALQAFCFYLPRIIWLFLSDRFGTSVMEIIRFSMSATTVDQEKRHRMVQYLASHIEKLLYYVQPYRRGRLNQLKIRCAQVFPCFVLTKRSGFVLVGSYLCVKLLFMANAVLQLIVMQRFLGMKSSHWGFLILSDLLNARTWNHTGIFPRVARCDITIANVGQTNTYTIQCVLPNNLLNEKIYIFLWFWVWLLMLLTAFSFVSWTFTSTMRSSRMTFMKKYLRIMSSIHVEEKALAKKFLSSFLRYDGIFILRMISYNSGDLMAAELIREIWLRFKSKKNDQSDDLPLMPPERPPRVRNKYAKTNNSDSRNGPEASAPPGAEDSASYV